MQRNLSRNHRMLLVAGGLAIVMMALVGPRSVWALLGLLPLAAGAVGLQPLLQISGRGRRRADGV